MTASDKACDEPPRPMASLAEAQGSSSVQAPGERSVAVGASAHAIITGDNVTYLHRRSSGLGIVLATVSALVLGGVVVAWYWPDAPADGAPLAATVEYAPSKDHCDGWTFPGKAPAQLAVPPGEPTADWAHRLGGIDESVTRLRVVIQGTNDHDVVLRNMRVIEQRKTRLPAGTAVALKWGCGGGLPTREYQAMLGRETTDLELLTTRDDGSVNVVERPFGYKVSATDPEIFAIAANAPFAPGSKQCNCLIAWKLALDWSYKGKQGTLVIDDQGAPFRTGETEPSNQYPLVVKDGNAWK